MKADASSRPSVQPVAGGLSVEIVDGIAPAEALWRGFEAEAISTPYQRYDWVAAYMADGPDGAARIVVVRDEDGRVGMLWPLAISRRSGIRIAAGIGGKHANFNLPLLRPGLALGAEDAEALLRRIGSDLGIDLIAVADMPESWDGEPNPFAGRGRPGPNVAPAVRLERDPDATALRSMSNEARKRLRNKERGLAKSGPVSFARAATEAEAAQLLDAFFRQKEARFRQLGIPDPFLDAGVRAFIRRAASVGLASGHPAIELYGLFVGDAVTAVLGGAADRRRLSGMFISFEGSPEATRYSPGDILVSRVIREQCRLGRDGFDLGTGEARYKRTFCDDDIRLLELLVPVTPAGRLAAGASALAVAAKRRLKQNPQAMRALALMRRMKPGAALP